MNNKSMNMDDRTESKIQQSVEHIVDEDMIDMRIDKYLSITNPDISRSYIQKLIMDEKVLIDKKPVKSSFKLKEGQVIRIYLPEEESSEIEPEDLQIHVIYEDEDIILVNKEKGMVVYPAKDHKNHTLVNGLLYHCNGQLSMLNGNHRPGIVHRLDKDTSGIIIACKNDNSLEFISEQFKEYTVTRRYQALVYNTFDEDSGRVEAPIGRHEKRRTTMSINHRNGKYAATNYKLLESLGHKYSHIECGLETGRTHQIRVHMASINHPLLGDTIYGPKKAEFGLDGQALHASMLAFIHPRTKEYMEFQAPLPDYFTKLLNQLRHG